VGVPVHPQPSLPHTTPALLAPSSTPTAPLPALSPYTGAEGGPIYIALDGIVFDMTSHPSGRDFYGPGSGYSIFAGKCATVGLAKMELDPSKWSSAINFHDFTPQQVETLEGWLAKYLTKYSVKGYLKGQGRYGTLTALQQKLAAADAASAAAASAEGKSQ
jgi:membrane-associated progesterone receptor component